MQGELVNTRLCRLPPPTKGCGLGYHVYCSQHNAGSFELITELVDDRDDLGECLITQDPDYLERCDHMLLYLTGQTWSRGEAATEALATELLQAMELNVHVLLVGADRLNPRF